jgi:hypothetical protein
MTASGWSRAGLVRAALIGLCALISGAGAGWAVSHERAPERPSAGTDVRALVAPLAVGARLSGWQIAALSPVEHGAIRLELTRGGERRALGIALDDPHGPKAPVVADRYALFAFGAELSGLDEPLAALAAVLHANRQVPIPAGLGRIAP